MVYADIRIVLAPALRGQVYSGELTVSPKADSDKSRFIRNRLQQNREIIQSLKERQDEKRTRSERVADFVTTTFGSIGFLTINIVWFAV